MVARQTILFIFICGNLATSKPVKNSTLIKNAYTLAAQNLGNKEETDLIEDVIKFINFLDSKNSRAKKLAKSLENGDKIKVKKPFKDKGLRFAKQLAEKGKYYRAKEYYKSMVYYALSYKINPNNALVKKYIGEAKYVKKVKTTMDSLIELAEKEKADKKKPVKIKKPVKKQEDDDDDDDNEDDDDDDDDEGQTANNEDDDDDDEEEEEEEIIEVEAVDIHAEFRGRNMIATKKKYVKKWVRVSGKVTGFIKGFGNNYNIKLDKGKCIMVMDKKNLSDEDFKTLKLSQKKVKKKKRPRNQTMPRIGGRHIPNNQFPTTPQKRSLEVSILGFCKGMMGGRVEFVDCKEFTIGEFIDPEAEEDDDDDDDD